MSVESKYFGFKETCGLSFEFRRRACTQTPENMSWAGDLIVADSVILKQSEVYHVGGGDSDMAVVVPAPEDSTCSDANFPMPEGNVTEITDIRGGGMDGFSYVIPHPEDTSEETQWDTGIYQSTGGTDYCGLFGHDGGDCLFHRVSGGRVVSLCGTIDLRGGNPAAYYLDNRKSHSADPDRGLLVAVRVGFVPEWTVRYALSEQQLADSADVTSAFYTALSLHGLTAKDILNFGMI